MGTLTEVFSNFLLFFLVFGMSATVDIDKLRKQLHNKHALLTGVSLQFVILPFVGFIVVKLCDFSAPVGLALLVVTSSPGGSYSNWWCSLFNAELALSVTMTALSTMLSVVMLPVNLIIYASGSYSSAVVKSLDWYALFMSLFVVIGGISSGLFCSAYFKDSPSKSHQIHKAANRFGNIAGLSLITYSIFVSSSDHKAALWDQEWQFFVGIATPAVIGITTATLLATQFKLDKPERVAVAVESCYQNTGIATSVAVVMFDGDKDSLAEAISVPLYYGMVEAFLLAIYCLICWKMGWTKAPADEKLCVVLATSYEVEQDEAIAQATDLDVVLQDISSKDDGEGGLKIKEISLPTPNMVFEEKTEATDTDVESLAATAVLRKVDSGDSGQVVDPESSHDNEVAVASTIGRGSKDSTIESSSAEMDEENQNQKQQMDGSGHNSVGRLGQTISFVKARATGYRRAPIPDADGQIQRKPPLPRTGIPQAGEASSGVNGRGYTGQHAEEANAEEQTPKGKIPLEAETFAEENTATNMPNATPADGKTLD